MRTNTLDDIRGDTNTETAGTAAQHPTEIADPWGEQEYGTIVAAAYRASAQARDFHAAAFPQVLAEMLKLRTQPLVKLAPQQATTDAKQEPAKQRRAPVQRRTPKAPAAAIERIKSIMDAAPEFVSTHAADLMQLTAQHKTYRVIEIAKNEFGIDGLTTAEIREILASKFRMPLAEGTLTGKLSTAPATELGRVKDEHGDMVYRIMLAGEMAVKTALAKKKAQE